MLCKINPSKACGPDDIPVEPITKLFTMSLQSEFLPSDWRQANVTPVFKRGNKHSRSNYRPISLTSLVLKCLECLVHARISEFLDANNKLQLSSTRISQRTLVPDSTLSYDS